jgi:nucleoid DNA-binding protein
MKKIQYVALIEILSEKTGFPKENVRKIMDTFIDEVKSLEEVGDKIYLRKLGKFEVIKMKQKVIELNNRKQKIPERNKLRFRFS